MPKAWTNKDERQYKKIRSACIRAGKTESRCEAIAAATVNKQRAKRRGRCVCPVGYNKRGRLCIKRGRRAGPKRRGMICPR